MNALKKYEEAKKSLNEFRAWREEIKTASAEMEIHSIQLDVYCKKQYTSHILEMPTGAEKVVQEWIKGQLENGDLLDQIEKQLQENILEEGSKLKTELIEFLATDLGPTVRGLA